MIIFFMNIKRIRGATRIWKCKKKPYGNSVLIKAKDEVKLVVNVTPKYQPYDKKNIIESKHNTINLEHVNIMQEK